MAVNKKILVIVIVAIVVIAGVTAAVIINNNNNGKSSDPVDPPVPTVSEAQKAAQAFVDDYKGAFKGDEDKPMTAENGIVTMYVVSNDKTLKFCIKFTESDNAATDFENAKNGAAAKIWTSSKATANNKNTAFGGFDGFYGIYSNWKMGAVDKGYMYFAAYSGKMFVETVGGVASSGEPNSANYIALNSANSTHADRFGVITSVAKAIGKTAVDSNVYAAEQFIAKYNGVFKGDGSQNMTAENGVVTSYTESKGKVLKSCITFTVTDNGATTYTEKTADIASKIWTSSKAVAGNTDFTSSGFDQFKGIYSNWTMSSVDKGYMYFVGYYGDIFVETYGGVASSGEPNSANYIALNSAKSTVVDREEVISVVGSVMGTTAVYSDSLKDKIQAFASSYGDGTFGPYAVSGYTATKTLKDKEYTMTFSVNSSSSTDFTAKKTELQTDYSAVKPASQAGEVTSSAGFDGVYAYAKKARMTNYTVSLYFVAYIGNVYIDGYTERQFSSETDDYASMSDINALLTAISTAFTA